MSVASAAERRRARQGRSPSGSMVAGAQGVPARPTLAIDTLVLHGVSPATWPGVREGFAAALTVRHAELPAGGGPVAARTTAPVEAAPSPMATGAALATAFIGSLAR